MYFIDIHKQNVIGRIYAELCSTTYNIFGAISVCVCPLNYNYEWYKYMNIDNPNLALIIYMSTLIC